MFDKAIPVAYCASAGDCQFDVVPAVVKSCHMPKYAARACWRARSAGAVDGVVDGVAPVRADREPGAEDALAPHAARASSDTAPRTAMARHWPLGPRKLQVITTRTPYPDLDVSACMWYTPH